MDYALSMLGPRFDATNPGVNQDDETPWIRRGESERQRLFTQENKFILLVKINCW
jgi:hypothetical protein